MKHPIIASLLTVALTTGLFADEITDNLATAKTAYEAGNYSEAVQALDYAGQLIRQKKGDAVAKILPDAPSGWTAKDAENESAGTAMMGGMVTARRHCEKGESSVKIEIQSDSPLLQSMAMMFANPMLITSSGAKLETVKGQRLAVNYRKDDKAGDIKAIIDNRYLLTIDGSNLSREELLAFASAFPFAELVKLK